MLLRPCKQYRVSSIPNPVSPSVIRIHQHFATYVHLHIGYISQDTFTPWNTWHWWTPTHSCEHPLMWTYTHMDTQAHFTCEQACKRGLSTTLRIHSCPAVYRETKEQMIKTTSHLPMTQNSYRAVHPATVGPPPRSLHMPVQWSTAPSSQEAPQGPADVALLLAVLHILLSPWSHGKCTFLS